MISHVTRLFRLSLTLPFLIFTPFLASSPAAHAQSAPAGASLLPGPKPPDVPASWKRWIGEYDHKDSPIVVFERDGRLWVSGRAFGEREFKASNGESFSANVDPYYGFELFAPDGEFKEVLGDTIRDLRRVDYSFHLTNNSGAAPSKAVAGLRDAALRRRPPKEPGPFRKPELVELVTLDPTIHLDIGYASANNFLSTPVYTEARAFMQRPAAEALLRVMHELQPLGYGLLIHDAYRPWYVTKIFWDATPPEGKIFVADPQKGSKHNRGCAVDLTLYDLATGQPVEMPGLYDEMSPRSFPNFPGGTSLQRWHRDLLRRAMESEGFTVNEDEWWHFDYKDWKQYGILNVPFEKIAVSGQPAAASH
jgi:D-alanyl-D-alanine dipeptidase